MHELARPIGHGQVDRIRDEAREHQLSAGVILRSVFWHSLALAVLVGLWVLLIAYALPALVVK